MLHRAIVKKQSPSRTKIRLLIVIAISACSIVSIPAFAQGLTVDNSPTVAEVYVNGGADTVNPGTTCLRVSVPVSAACTAGVLAIPNNNKQLFAAALTAKATGSKIWLYYDDNAGSLHCPGAVFTPCSVISISLK